MQSPWNTFQYIDFMNYFGFTSIVLHNEINVLVIKFLFGEAIVVIYVEIQC